MMASTVLSNIEDLFGHGSRWSATNNAMRRLASSGSEEFLRKIALIQHSQRSKLLGHHGGRGRSLQMSHKRPPNPSALYMVHSQRQHQKHCSQPKHCTANIARPGSPSCIVNPGGSALTPASCILGYLSTNDKSRRANKHELCMR